LGNSDGASKFFATDGGFEVGPRQLARHTNDEPQP
jgi:hypothetical protein